ncbi:glycosyltransferase family 2 protein [Dethiothermospora halolimnae]|uniref:glycosyltransferase family 2 protein n=1 Tax=Dethiothermospora halolimnae TaxID=3114390 RepID=UPI003CCB7D04
MYKITAIIPAFNEEETIGDILKTIKKIDLIEEIIVVSDGSTDRTIDIAKSLNVEVVELSNNIGKGGAVKRGVEKSHGDIVLFLDADLIGLRSEHVTRLLLPVISDECDMSIGVFDNGRFITDLAQKLTPFLTGQRAIKTEVFNDIPNIEITRYGIEVAITKHVTKNNINIKSVTLENITHVMKEEKMGLIKGATERLKMYRDILKFLIIGE